MVHSPMRLYTLTSSPWTLLVISNIHYLFYNINQYVNSSWIWPTFFLMSISLYLHLTISLSKFHSLSNGLFKINNIILIMQTHICFSPLIIGLVICFHLSVIHSLSHPPYPSIYLSFDLIVVCFINYCILITPEILPTIFMGVENQSPVNWHYQLKNLPG